MNINTQSIRLVTAWWNQWNITILRLHQLRCVLISFQITAIEDKKNHSLTHSLTLNFWLTVWSIGNRRTRRSSIHSDLCIVLFRKKLNRFIDRRGWTHSLTLNKKSSWFYVKKKITRVTMVDLFTHRNYHRHHQIRSFSVLLSIPLRKINRSVQNFHYQSLSL